MGHANIGEPDAIKVASPVRGDGMGKRAWGNPVTRPVSIQRATLIITIMTLVMVAIWNTTNARADATNTIITDNVPTAAQP